MKEVIIFLLAVSVGRSVQAQTWEEWTRQKRTQIKYLVKQVAALQSYIGYVREGYAIADKGLQLIGSIKDGDFHLHDDFFAALQKVNPAVGRFVKGFEIGAKMSCVYKIYESLLKEARSSDQFTSSEIEFIQRLCGRIIDDVIRIAEEIAALGADGGLKFNDAERLERAEKLCKSVAEKEMMMRKFADENRMLVRQRAMELNDVNVMRRLYNQR